MLSVTNAGPDPDLLHVLPTLWYRNTWSWDVGVAAPMLTGTGAGTVATEHPFMGALEWLAGPDPGGGPPELVFCDNETNLARLYGVLGGPRWPKDGINDHVVSGADSVNPQRRGSKCAAWYPLTVGPGETAELRLRPRPGGIGPEPATKLFGATPAMDYRRAG